MDKSESTNNDTTVVNFLTLYRSNSNYLGGNVNIKKKNIINYLSLLLNYPSVARQIMTIHFILISIFIK